MSSAIVAPAPVNKNALDGVEASGAVATLVGVVFSTGLGTVGGLDGGELGVSSLSGVPGGVDSICPAFTAW